MSLESPGGSAVYSAHDRSTMYNAPGGSITVYETASSGRGPSIPRRPPQAPRVFVNRDKELKALQHILSAPGRTQWRTVVVLSGPGGVGKTGLALYWANEVNSLYPDGCFVRNLNGYGPGPGDEPANAHDVLADWLSLGWGLKSTDIPNSREGRAELFRTKIAGQRVLVVLDNAARADQVRPLLPAESCLVITTSRNRLPGLISEGAHLIEVEPLSPENAIELLRMRVGDRIDEDTAAAAQLAKYCACLPLTLHTAATRLKNEPDGSVAVQVQRLSSVRRRLHRLGHPDDQATDVEAVNSLSYQTLPADAQRLFRLLALHPAAGETAEIYSIARLAGLDLDTTEDLLDLLGRENLISKIGDRYGSRHDVLHLYARQLIDRDEYAAERREALDRLAHAYYGCVNHAFDWANRNNPMVDAEFLTNWRQDYPEGVSSVEHVGKPAVWFANERMNLVALVRSVGDIAPPFAITPRLGCSLFYFLEMGGHLTDWEEVEEIAARAAWDYGDRHDQARSLRDRGRIKLVKILNDQERRRYYGEAVSAGADGYLDAVTMLQKSRDLYHAEFTAHRQRKDRAGEATALRELADLYRLRAGSDNLNTIDQAIDAYRKAEHAFEEIGSENALASLRLALGIAHTLKGDQTNLEQANHCFRASLDFGSKLNEKGTPQHPRLKGYALSHLGDLYRESNDFVEAIACYEQSASTFSDSEDHISEGRCLVQLGRILADYSRNLFDTGDQVGARDVLSRARSSFTDAMELLSTSPDEVETIIGWLGRLGTCTDD